MSAVDEFKANVRDEPTLHAFLARHDVAATDALIVMARNGDAYEKLASVEPPSPRSASIIVLRG